jgi:hypothetical protein
MRKPEYIRFREELGLSPKTRLVSVVTVQSGVTLGVISWYAPWRQYVFRPETDTIFNPDCLDQIEQYARKMTGDHREALRLRGVAR